MLWRRRKTEAPDVPSPEQAEAIKALDKADRQVEDAVVTNTEITTTTKLLSRYHDQNNFAEMIREVLGGTR